MRCDRVIERLDGFRTGELAERELRAVDQHVSGCESCAAELGTLRELARTARALAVRAPAGLLERVLASASLRYGAVETALGRVWVAFGEAGVALVDLSAPDEEAFERACRGRLGARPTPAPVPAAVADTVRAAAEGAPLPAADPPVDLSSRTPFERRVLRAIGTIPRGQVRPYAWVAKEVGRPGAVRAVGNALARNPVPLLLPCHRVVPSAGGVGSYRFGSELKRALLEREGTPLPQLERLSAQGVRYLASPDDGSYCLPSCWDLRAYGPESWVGFPDAARAEAAGYRPCRRCRPAAIAA